MAKKLSSNLFKVSIAPENGADATTYWLVPSVTQVKRKADGSHLPEYVSCECFSKTGDGNPVSGGGTIKFVLTYKTGSNSAEFVYGSRIIVTSDMAAISFRLYVGGTQVDEKTVSVVEDGQEGLPGPAGVRGRLPFPSGAFELSTVYTCTDDITPIVYYEAGKTYYTMRKNGNSVGIDPAEDYASNGSDSTWIPFENYKAIFTEILMANFAKLASAVFYGDYMFSQQGIDANGDPTSNYQEFNPNDPQSGNFSPNLAFNLKTGDQYSNGGHVYGFATNTPIFTNTETIDIKKVAYSKVNVLFAGKGNLSLPNDKKFDGVEFLIVSTTNRAWNEAYNIFGIGDTSELYTGIYYKGSEIRTCFMRQEGSFIRLLAYWTGTKLKYYVVGHSDNFIHVEPVLNPEGIEVPAGVWFVDRTYTTNKPVRVYYDNLPMLFLKLAIYSGQISPNVSDLNFNKPT